MIKVKPDFPIVRDVIENGHHFIHSVNENEKVKCCICNHPIILNKRNIHVAEDGMQMVDCPACKSHVSILYYFDQIERKNKGPVHAKPHRGQRLREGRF